jgi:hypothetical protein
MAVTLQAIVGVSNSSVENGQVINGVVTVFNQGTTPTTVTTIQLFPGSQLSQAADSVALGSINVNGPGMLNGLPAVSAGGVPGQVSFPFSVCVYGGLQPITTLSSEFAFPVQAYVSTSDGSFVVASTATVQCTAPQTTTISPGAFPYTPSPGPLASTTATNAQPGQYPNLPVAGQMRLDSNLDSAIGMTVLAAM